MRRDATPSSAKDALFRPAGIACLLLTLLTAQNALGQRAFESFVNSSDVAPGTGGAEWQFFSAPFLSDDGSVAFSGRLFHFGDVDSSNESGLWGGTTGNLQLIAREGSPAPGASGQPWLDLTLADPMLADGGRVAFTARTESPDFGDDAGVWSASISGAPSKLALDGEPSAGTTNGETYRSFGGGGSRPDTNAAGQVVFEGQVGIAAPLGGHFSNSIRTNLWTGTPGNVTLTAEGRTAGGSGGDPAPGLPGQVWSSFLSPTINDSGTIAFYAFTSAADGSGDSRRGIWAGSPQNVQHIVSQGGAAAGTGGDTWVDFGSGSSSSGPALNNNGLLAFNATVANSTGDQRTGVWLHDAGTTRLLALEGRFAPGDPDLTISGFGQVSVNTGGQVAFEAFLSGPGINANNNEAIYATDAYGQLMKIYRERETMQLDGQDISGRAFSLAETGAISGDATQGTARLGMAVSYFAGGNQAANILTDLNDVFIDADITHRSLWLGDRPGTHETAGDLHVGYSSAETATLYLTHFPPKLTAGEPAHSGPVTVIANNAFYGVRPGTTGEGYIEQTNTHKLTGSLFIGGDPASGGGTGYLEVRDGGALQVDGSTTIAAGSSLEIQSGGTASILGPEINNNGTLTVEPGASLATGPTTTLTGNGTYNLSLVADTGVVLSPGNSPGAMSIAQLTLADGAYDWELTTLPGGGSAGNEWDLIESSTLDITATTGSPFTINVLDISGEILNTDQTSSWLIASSDDPIIGFDPDHFIFDLSGAGQFADTGEFTIELMQTTGAGAGLVATFTPSAITGAVPEPSSALLLLGIGSCAAWRRRRRR